MKKEFIIERQGKSFVLYAGLLEEAHGQGLKEIGTQLLQVPSPENGSVAIVHATVETERGRFSGLGDASPENTSNMMRAHTIRLAETRAKARALRDAINVGMVALEELGDEDAARDSGPAPYEPSRQPSRPQPSPRQPSPPASTGPAAMEEFRPALSQAAPEPRELGPRAATEKQLKAIYAIAQAELHMDKSEVEARCQDIYGYAPGELSRWEASQFIDLLKQDKVA